MHIQLHLPRNRLRQWHLALACALADHKTTAVSVVLRDSETSMPAALALLLALEEVVQRGQHGDDLTARRSPQDFAAFTDNRNRHGSPNLNLVIGCDADVAPEQHAVRLLFDAQPSEDAMWLALLDRRAPMLAVQHRGARATDWQPSQVVARPALETPHILNQSGGAVVSRAIDVVVQMVRTDASSPDLYPVAPLLQPHTQSPLQRASKTASARVAPIKPLSFLSRRVAEAAQRRLTRVLRNAPIWQAAWQPTRAFDPSRETVLHAEHVSSLAASNTSYFADPFPLVVKNTTYVFVEEVPFATNRGHISVVTINQTGQVSAPQPVLESGSHLSYPQVLSHDNEIWMVPESAASGGVDLYRADPFPTRWQHVARIIDEPLHDATLHCDGTRWWLFATAQSRASSTWCGLKVFTADALRGPWRACYANAFIKIDAASARPAGPLIHREGALWRPTQNCSSGYGNSLTWCRVDRLDDDGFEETPMGKMRFATNDGWKGPHTWAETSAITVLDLFAPVGNRPAKAVT